MKQCKPKYHHFEYTVHVTWDGRDFATVSTVFSVIFCSSILRVYFYAGQLLGDSRMPFISTFNVQPDSSHLTNNNVHDGKIYFCITVG